MSDPPSDFNLSLDVTATRIPPPDTPAPAPTPMQTVSNKLWLRSWNLSVEQPGEGLGTVGGGQVIGVSNLDPNTVSQGGTQFDLSDFRIVFSVEQVMSQMPWKFTATVYNVPLTLANQIAKQYTNVYFTAGYRLPQPKSANTTTITYAPDGSPIGTNAPIAQLPQGYKPGGSLLFDGAVVWYERGRENATDTFLRIYANTFDIAHNQSAINTTLPAGSTQKDVVQACVDAMAKDNPGIKMGTLTAGMKDVKSPRARTLYGMPREILRDVAQSVGGYVLIDPAGRVNIVKTTDNLPPQGAETAPPIIKLNRLTGMVGVPRQNMDGGMSVRCLLNPAIQPFTQIQLNNNDVVQKSLSQTSPIPGGGGLPGEVRDVGFQQGMIAADGIYKVWSAIHNGDTRGNPWYTDIITFAANPASQAPKIG